MSSKIVVWDVAEIDDDKLRPDTTYRSGKKKLRGAMQAVEVDIDTLSQNLVGFIENVRGMLAKVSSDAEQFQVEKVEVSAQIGAEGEVGFLGTGVKAKGGASLKIVLERRKDRESES